MADEQKQERAILVAEQIKLLFIFCYRLIDDLEIIEEAGNQAQNNASLALALAPVMGAVGMDYEKSHLAADIKAKRAKALAELIRTLKTTQEEINQLDDKDHSMESHRRNLSRILGES